MQRTVFKCFSNIAEAETNFLQPPAHIWSLQALQGVFLFFFQLSQVLTTHQFYCRSLFQGVRLSLASSAKKNWILVELSSTQESWRPHHDDRRCFIRGKHLQPRHGTQISFLVLSFKNTPPPPHHHDHQWLSQARENPNAPRLKSFDFTTLSLKRLLWNNNKEQSLNDRTFTVAILASRELLLSYGTLRLWRTEVSFFLCVILCRGWRIKSAGLVGFFSSSWNSVHFQDIVKENVSTVLKPGYLSLSRLRNSPSWVWKIVHLDIAKKPWHLETDRCRKSTSLISQQSSLQNNLLGKSESSESVSLKKHCFSRNQALRSTRAADRESWSLVRRLICSSWQGRTLLQTVCCSRSWGTQVSLSQIEKSLLRSEQGCFPRSSRHELYKQRDRQIER